MEENMFALNAPKIFLFALLLLFSLHNPLEASNPTDRLLIISDTASLSPEKDKFTASGRVEIYFDGIKLMTSKLSFDTKTEWVTIEGPFRLTERDGTTLIYGRFADLSPEFYEGVVYAVKRIVDRTLEVQADELKREKGRYSKFKHVRATACETCFGSKIPLWQLVASKATHDSEKKATTYRNARLLIRGVPVAYTPWIRIPDPSVKRTDGFLRAELKSNSLLGNQIILPYFKTLGNRADLTISPHLTLRRGNKNVPANNTLEAKYRQIFPNGYLELNGAVSHDQLTKDSLRGYFFSNGKFDLPNGFKLNFDTQASSDNSYLGTYKFFTEPRTTYQGEAIVFGVDRLRDRFSFSKKVPGEIINFSYDHFKPLLAPEHNYETANTKINFNWIKSVSSGVIPGDFKLATLVQHYGNDFGDANVRQVDTSRIGANLTWNYRGKILSDVDFENDIGFFVDQYQINDTIQYDRSQSGLGYNFSSKFIKQYSIIERDNVELKINPYAGFVTFKTAEFDIPNADGSNIDVLDPLNIGRLDRFVRIDRNQNFNHDLSYLTLGVPINLKLENGYYVKTGLTADKLVNSDASYVFSNGLVYDLGFGKKTGKMRFSTVSKFNDNGDNIFHAIDFKNDFKFIKISGGYLFQQQDQEFYLADKRREWSLDIGANIGNEMALKLGTKYYDLKPRDSYSTLALSYNDNKIWRANLGTKYLREQKTIESKKVDLYRSLSSRSELFFEYEDILEKSERRRVGWSYGTECMKARASISNFKDVTADRESIDEFSLVLKLGSFGGKAAQRCG